MVITIGTKYLSRRQRAYCRCFFKREMRRGNKKAAIIKALASRFEVGMHTIRRVLGNEYKRQDNIDSDNEYLDPDQGVDSNDDEDGNESQRKVRPATALPSKSNSNQARSNTTTAIHNPSARAPPPCPSARIAPLRRCPSPPSGDRNKTSFKELLYSLELEHLVETFEDRGFKSAQDVRKFRHQSRSTRQYIFGILYDSGLVDLKELAVLYGAFDCD